jgi:hypothetical protein
MTSLLSLESIAGVITSNNTEGMANRRSCQSPHLTGEQVKELVVISLGLFRVRKNSCITDILLAVYKKEPQRTESFDEWKREVPVVVADTLYNHSDRVFTKNSRQKIKRIEEAEKNGKKKENDLTPAQLDGKKVEKALKQCGVQVVYRWDDHLNWVLYDTLRNSIDEHLKTRPELTKLMKEHAKAIFYRRKKDPKKKLPQEKLNHLLNFLKEETVSVRFGFEWCAKSAKIWHPVSAVSSNSFASSDASTWGGQIRQMKFDSWDPPDIEDVVIPTRDSKKSP